MVLCKIWVIYAVEVSGGGGAGGAKSLTPRESCARWVDVNGVLFICVNDEFA